MAPALLKRALSKPLPVVWFRARQAASLRLMHRSGAWPRIARDAQARFAGAPVAAAPVLMHASPPRLGDAERAALDDIAGRVRQSDFELLGARVPDLDSCDFSADWRYGKTWPKGYFRQHAFYERKDVPYDVKMPWELSRFHYLVPLLARQWAGASDPNELRWIAGLLRRWRADNPVAFSVNWYPMEASMRLVSLVMLADLALLLMARETDPERRAPAAELASDLLVMTDEHGMFVWHNREFTDVRGNHFTANIVGLHLAALLLDRQGRGRPAWRRHARHWLDREIGLQFCADGVNFEKSCGYHKLVLELFLLAGIAAERDGSPLQAASRERLARAAAFSDALTRPDGRDANFGDTDDATALPFLFERTHSHGAVVGLARSWLDRAIGSHAFPPEEALAALFITGRRPAGPSVPEGPEVIEFPLGGYVVVRDAVRGFFFMADVGEVGMNGRGGHGHNDLLAFELCMEGVPVVIDPGSPCYTADLDKKAAYRRTGVHATVELFGEEMARLSGHWGIADDARPRDVTMSRDGDVVVLRAAHDGYARLAAGTRVSRTFRIAPLDGQLDIVDEIETTAAADVTARWCFPVGNAGARRTGDDRIEIGDRFPVELSSDIHLEVMQATYSDGYGHEAAGQAVVGVGHVAAGMQQFSFTFRTINGRR